MPTRLTHAHAGPIAVFIIGFRINKLWRPDAWGPVFAAMPKMLKELYADPDSGFLDARVVVDGPGLTTIQYWRSVDDIYRYANAGELEHRPAWLAFYTRAKRVPGAVGIFHETFGVPDGAHESLFVDMPLIGIARATGTVDAASRGHTARERIAHRPAA